MVKIFLFWLPMILIAFANATLREMILTRHFSGFRANQLSTVTLIILCSVYTWCIFSKLPVNTYKQALWIGSIWMILTVIFEFALGRLTKKTWQELLQNYDLMHGYIWPLFL